jgi:response regulator of citrate/malate metabolism
MKKILVADVPSMDGRYAAAFAGWQVVYVRTMSQAQQALDNGSYDLIAIGVYFDDSRMFDLVREVRGDERHGEVPIVCVRGSPGFAAITTRTLEVTIKALAADEFLDLLHFGEEQAGNAALRAAAERYFSG